LPLTCHLSPRADKREYFEGITMDRITAMLLSIIIGALATYQGGTIFFQSGSQLAVALETHLLTRHTYMVIFMALVAMTYLVLSWIPHLITKFRGFVSR
jgi:hypothetical protein